MDSLDLPKREGEREEHLYRRTLAQASTEMFAKSGDYVDHSGIYRFPLVCLPDSLAMARVPFARPMLLIPVYLPPSHCQDGCL